MDVLLDLALLGADEAYHQSELLTKAAGPRGRQHVNVMKEVPPPTSTVPSRPAPPKPEKQAPPAPALVADVPAFSPNPESSNIQGPEESALTCHNRAIRRSSRDLALLNLTAYIQVRTHKVTVEDDMHGRE